MKFLLILTVLMMSMYVVYGDVNQTCSWQQQRNNLIKKLTPAGQSTVIKILLDLQYIFGAAVQPIFGYLEKKYTADISRITNSTDSANFAKLGAFLGYNNPKIGSPPLWDNCQNEKTLNSIVASFSSANRAVVQNMINDYGSLVMSGLPSVLSINALLDAALYTKLGKTENATTLTALQKLYTLN